MSYKERMHSTISNAEIDVFKELSKRDLTKGMVTQKPIVLKATIPDFLWQERKIAVYLDGEPHMKSKQMEKDEEITMLLEKRGFSVLRISYEAPLTHFKLTEIVNQIQLFVEGEDNLV